MTYMIEIIGGVTRVFYSDDLAKAKAIEIEWTQLGYRTIITIY